MKYLLFFILGVFTGIVIFSISVTSKGHDDFSTDDLKGTVYNSRSFETMKPADVLVFDHPIVRAGFDVKYSTQIVEVRMDLSCTDPVKIMVEFEYENFRPLSLYNVTGDNQSSAFLAGNFAQIINSGNNKYILQLLNKNSLPHPITFKILQNDIPVYTNSVTVNKE